MAGEEDRGKMELTYPEVTDLGGVVIDNGLTTADRMDIRGDGRDDKNQSTMDNQEHRQSRKTLQAQE